MCDKDGTVYRTYTAPDGSPVMVTMVVGRLKGDQREVFERCVDLTLKARGYEFAAPIGNSKTRSSLKVTNG